MKKIDNEILTYFKITGEFEPDEITKELGLVPISTWKKGEQRKTGVYTFSLWEFNALEKQNNAFADEQMRETIAPLIEKTDVLRTLKEKYGLTYTLEVVPKFYSTREKPILSPPKEVIDFCSLTDTMLDIDYYFYFDTDPSEE